MTGRMRASLERSLAAGTLDPRADALVELARAYADECDLIGVRGGKGESDPGTGYLAAIKSLGLTPGAERRSPGRGTDGVVTPLQRLRDAARERRAGGPAA